MYAPNEDAQVFDLNTGRLVVCEQDLNDAALQDHSYSVGDVPMSDQEEEGV